MTTEKRDSNRWIGMKCWPLRILALGALLTLAPVGAASACGYGAWGWASGWWGPVDVSKYLVVKTSWSDTYPLGKTAAESIDVLNGFSSFGKRQCTGVMTATIHGPAYTEVYIERSFDGKAWEWAGAVYLYKDGVAKWSTNTCQGQYEYRYTGYSYW